jgi:hypothetical protein
MVTFRRSQLSSVYVASQSTVVGLGLSNRWIDNLAPVLDALYLWRWLALGLVVRIALSPLQHTWDSQTWWNVASELGRESDPLRAIGLPFEQMRQLSDLSHGSGFRTFYEYWAYPPGMLIIWWPIARAWYLVMGTIPEQFAGPDAFAAAPLPLLLSVSMKLPVVAADAASALLLARLASPRLARWYWLNPYVWLVGLWTFDGVMLALLLGGLLAARNQRWALAGGLLGCGAAVKFVPVLLVPVVMLWAFRTARQPVRAAAMTGVAAIATFGVICAPWLDGVAYVVSFHASRVGGGMSWQAVWGAIVWIDPFADLSPVYGYLSAQIGFLTLSGCLLLATWGAWLRRLDLLRMSLVVLLAYLAGSKLVNEAYPLPAVALCLVVLCARPTVGGARLLAVLWITPLLFALVNVPAWGFGLAPAEALGWTTIETARAFYAGYLLTYQHLAPVLAVVGTLFQIGCLVGVWSLLRPFGMREVRQALGATA